MTHTPLSNLLRGSLLAGLLAVAGVASAGTGPKHEMRAAADRQDCATDAQQNDRANCRREGAAARLEASRGGLTTPDAAARERNALERCKVHNGENRASCERMVRGEGKSSGTVASGGQIRELTTVTVEPKR